MAESFGLDRKIENYSGKKPIGLYRWDLDCLEDVLFLALEDEDEYPDKSGDNYEAMKRLYSKICQLRTKAYENL